MCLFNRNIHHGWCGTATLDLFTSTDGFWLVDWQTVDNVEISMKNKLRVLRAERRWSQAMLAEMADVSRQTINAIETEKYDPSLPLAFKLAAIFELTIEAIFQPEQ